MTATKALRFLFKNETNLLLNYYSKLLCSSSVRHNTTSTTNYNVLRSTEAVSLPSYFPSSTEDQVERVSAVLENLQEGTLAYKERSSLELMRSLMVLKLSSVDLFVNYSEQILHLSKTVLRQRLFDTLLKYTFFGQFCAGETIKEVNKTVSLLKDGGIRSMLCVPIEASDASIDMKIREKMWEENFQTVLECINRTAELEENGFSQLKITALCSQKLLLEMNPAIGIYDQDRSQESEWDVAKVAHAMESGNIEGISMASLDEDLNQELRELLRKSYILAKECHEKGLRLMIDAEQTYIQNSLNYIVLVLQAIFNRQQPVVYNTYQCYRKDTLARVTEDHLLGKKLNFKIAGKLVRGAYMDEERRLAAQHGYSDPINDSYEATNEMYHSVADYLFPLIASGETGVMIASHNEDTVEFVINRMHLYDISLDDPNLCFAQVLGMCDHVSYSLGKFGYQVYKSTPYGTVDKTLLYLCRRARENRSVMTRATFEKKLLKSELKSRVKIFAV